MDEIPRARQEDDAARHEEGLAPASVPAAEPLLDDGVFSPGRMRVEREQAYFNDLYLLAPLAYFVLGLDGVILQMNLVAAELFGLPRERPGHVLFRTFVSPPFHRDYAQFVERVLNSSEPERIQLQVQLRPASQAPGLPVSLLGSTDQGGQVLRLVLEQAEGKMAALERSEERFRRIVHSAEEGIWEIDAQALTSFVNPKMAHMLGYQIEEMLGKPLAASWMPRDVPCWSAISRAARMALPNATNSSSCAAMASHCGRPWPPIPFLTPVARIWARWHW